MGQPLVGGRPFFSFETGNNVPRAKPEESSPHSFLVSVRVGLEGDRLNSPLVVHKPVHDFSLKTSSSRVPSEITFCLLFVQKLRVHVLIVKSAEAWLFLFLATND